MRKELCGRIVYSSNLLCRVAGSGLLYILSFVMSFIRIGGGGGGLGVKYSFKYFNYKYNFFHCI